MLDWTRFSYRPTSGEDQFRDELILGQGEERGSALLVQNFVRDRFGRLAKRGGIKRILDLSSTLSGAKRIASGTNELVVMDDHKMFALDESTLSVRDCGLVGPGSLRVKQIDAVADQQRHSAMCLCESSAGEVYIVIVSMDGEGSGNTRLRMTVTREDGTIVLARKEIAGYDDFTFFVCSTEEPTKNGRYAILCFYNGSAWTFWRWDADAPLTDPTNIGSQGLAGTPDIIGIPGGFAYAFVNSSSEAELVAKDESFGNLFSTTNRVVTTRTTYYRNSLGWDGVNGKLIWARMYTTTSTNRGIDISTHTVSDTLPFSLGDTNILAPRAFASVAPAMMFAPNMTSAVTGGDVIVVVYTDYSDPSYNGSYYARYNVTTGATASDLRVGGQAHAKPWSYNGRYYCACSTDQQADVTEGIHFVQDLNIGEEDTKFEVSGDPTFEYDQPFPVTVAAWSALTSVPIPSFTSGGYGPMPTFSGSKVYWTAQSYTDKADFWRASTFLVSLDYSFRNDVVKSVRGGLFVTGSIQAWYDGINVSELGVLNCRTPIITKITGSETGPDIYTQAVVWDYLDSLGCVHRSYPITATLTVSSHNGVSTSVPRSIIPTMRNPVGEKIFINFFRAINSSRLQGGGNLSATRGYVAADVPDIVITTGIVYSGGKDLYTIDGIDLPNIPFGACEHATMTTERLWVCGLPLGGEIQFSDQIRPTGTAANPPAPEFHPSLRIQSPGGFYFNGMASIQDKVIVFSEDGTYVVDGRGPDYAGGGDDSTGLLKLSDDFGCIEPESLIQGPTGIMFQAKQGFGVVRPDMSVSFIGNPVGLLEDYSIIDSAHFEDLRSLLWLLDNGESTLILLYDYVTDTWMRWTTPTRMASMCVHDRKLYLLSVSERVYVYDDTISLDQDDTVTNIFYTARLRTPWYNMDGSNSGWQSVRWVALKGTRGGEEIKATLTMYYNGDNADVATRTLPWATITKAELTQLDFKWDVPRKRCKLFSFEWADAVPDNGQGGVYSIQSIDFELGRMRGTYKTGVKA